MKTRRPRLMILITLFQLLVAPLGAWAQGVAPGGAKAGVPIDDARAQAAFEASGLDRCDARVFAAAGGEAVEEAERGLGRRLVAGADEASLRDERAELIFKQGVVARCELADVGLGEDDVTLMAVYWDTYNRESAREKLLGRLSRWGEPMVDVLLEQARDEVGALDLAGIRLFEEHEELRSCDAKLLAEAWSGTLRTEWEARALLGGLARRGDLVGLARARRAIFEHAEQGDRADCYYFDGAAMGYVDIDLLADHWGVEYYEAKVKVGRLVMRGDVAALAEMEALSDAYDHGCAH